MPEVRRVAVLTGQEQLRAAATRFAALAGVELDPVSASSGMHRAWRASHAVIVGGDLAAAVAAAGLPRRDRVVVVSDSDPDAALWQSTVQIGATGLMTLPGDDHLLLDFLSDATDASAVAGSAIAVVGGCGGAGASTFAAAMGVSSAAAGSCLLIDADRIGGGLDVLLGVEQDIGARWPDLAETRGRLATSALAEALPAAAGCSVLSWDRSGAASLEPAAAEAVIDAGLRGFRRVIVDLPRVLDDAAVALAAGCDLTIVVVPATVRALAATVATLAAMPAGLRGIHVVVRDPSAGRLRVDHVADVLGLPVVAAFSSDAAVVRAADRGEPPLRRGRSPLAAACRKVLALAGAAAAAA